MSIHADTMLSSYKLLTMFCEVSDSFRAKLQWHVAFNMTGEHIVPNNSTLNLYVVNSLLGSCGFLKQRNLVRSLSPSLSCIHVKRLDDGSYCAWFPCMEGQLWPPSKIFDLYQQWTAMTPSYSHKFFNLYQQCKSQENYSLDHFWV